MYIENEKNTVFCVKNANKRNVKTAFFPLNCITAWKKICSFDIFKTRYLQKIFICMYDLSSTELDSAQLQLVSQ